MTDQQVGMAAAVGAMAGMAMVLMLVAFVMWVLLIIAHWKMFNKAGEPGWKSIIPIYSDYVLFDLVWDTKNFFIYFGLLLATCISSALGTSYTVNVNGEVVASGGNMILSVISLVAGIAALVWGIRLQLKTASAYGKGLGFGIGLIFLPNIFTLILGFGDAEYVGPQEG